MTSTPRGLSAAAMLVVWLAPAAATQIPFATKDTIDGAFNSATGVSYGDVDGDGDLDVVAAAGADHDVSWFQNSSGDGSVWTEFSVDVSFTGAAAVEATDIDGDGDLDILAAAFAAGAVHWWENDGTPTDDTTDDGSGNFWTEHVIETGLTQARAVLAADLDRDGHLDVVAAGVSANAVRWWLSDGSPADDTGGDGNSWTELTIDSAFGGATAVFAADVDGDGDPDIVGAANSDDDVVWWENDGDPSDNTVDLGSGNFWVERVVDSTFDGARSVHVADLDQDGDLDVLSAADADHDVTWWENDGDPSDNTTHLGGGAFWPERTIDADFMGAFGAVAVDLDCDGDLDVLGAASIDDDVAWWESDGTPADGGWTERTVDAAFDGPRAVVAADLDGDGDGDVLASAFDGDEVAWWQNKTIHGSARFPASSAVTSGGAMGDGSAAADIDGDGDVDLVSHVDRAGMDPDDLVWWENTGGDGSSWTEHVIGPPPRFDRVSAGDVDGDGDVDVFASASSSTERISWFENTAGDGSAWTEHQIKPDSGISVTTDLADLDGDGDLDFLLIEKFLGGLATWWQNVSGDGATLTEHTIHSSPGLAGGGQAADVDGDGDLDVVVSIANVGTLWWENDGDLSDNTVDLGSGNFWPEHLLGTVDQLTTPATGDIDGDGDLDIVNRDTTGFAWWENDGTPADGGWIVRGIEAGFNNAVLTVDDVDRDGDLDLVANNATTLVFAWWENVVGDGSSWTQRILASDEIATGDGPVVADVDGDGMLDLSMVHVGGTRELRWYRNRGGQFALQTTSTAPVNVENSATEAVLEIETFHRGRAADADVELATLELLFEETTGDPLDDTEANALVENLFVYLDDGSEAFEVGSDALVATVATLALTAGVQTVTLPDGNADVQIAHGSTKLYHVVVETTSDATGQTPNSFEISHLTETSSSAEDAANDIPLLLEFAADVSTGTITAQVCYALTLGHTGQGADPGASPSESTGCPAGEYVSGESIALTAVPDEDWVVDGWTGTDNDAATTTGNTVTMPAMAHAASVTYVLADDVLIENTSFTTTKTRKACSSITAQTSVTVENGADVTFLSPTAILGDGFSVDSGGTFTVDTGQPAECSP